MNIKSQPAQAMKSFPSTQVSEKSSPTEKASQTLDKAGDILVGSVLRAGTYSAALIPAVCKGVGGATFGVVRGLCSVHDENLFLSAAKALPMAVAFGAVHGASSFMGVMSLAEGLVQLADKYS